MARQECPTLSPQLLEPTLAGRQAWGLHSLATLVAPLLPSLLFNPRWCCLAEAGRKTPGGAATLVSFGTTGLQKLAQK